MEFKVVAEVGVAEIALGGEDCKYWGNRMGIEKDPGASEGG